MAQEAYEISKDEHNRALAALEKMKALEKDFNKKLKTKTHDNKTVLRGTKESNTRHEKYYKRTRLRIRDDEDN